MKRVIYLTYDGLTDPLGQSQIMPYLVGLGKKGHQISIVSFEKKNALESQKSIYEELKKVNIQWYPLSYTRSPVVLSTIYDIYRLNRIVTKLHKKEAFQIVHCRSYITALIGLRLKKKKGVKFIFDMRGFWADERIEGEIWNIKNPLFKVIYDFFKRKEIEFFVESDAVVSLTQAGKEVINKSIIPHNDAAIYVIPCCVDNNHFDPVIHTDGSKLKSALKIDSKSFILGYVGSIGTWYMLPEMIDFYSEFLKTEPNTVFLFVSRDNPSTIKSAFEKRNCNTDRLRIVSAKRDEVPGFISIMDWSIFFIKPVFSKQASSPTKQGELMSMGIPIVCNTQIGDTDLIIRKYNGGISVDQMNSVGYQNTISKMRRFTPDKSQIRAGSIDYFGLDKGVKKYQEIYENL